MTIRQSRMITLINAASSYYALSHEIHNRMSSPDSTLEDIYAYFTQELSALDTQYTAAIAIEQHHFATTYRANERARLKKEKQRREANIPIRNQISYLGETYNILPAKVRAPDVRLQQDNLRGSAKQLQEEDEEEQMRLNRLAYELYVETVNAGGYGKGPLMDRNSGTIIEPGEPLYDRLWKENSTLLYPFVKPETDDGPKLSMEVDDPDDES